MASYSPFEAWGFFDSKPDRNVPLWIQKWIGNMLQNTRLQRNGRQSPKSYYGTSNSCVKPWSIGLRTYTSKLKSTAKNVRFTHDDERLRNVRCFECKWRTKGPLETFGSKVVVGWRFSGHLWTTTSRPATGSQQYVEMNTLTSRVKGKPSSSLSV